MPGAQILRELGGGWFECLDDQGIFYHNQSTGQSSDTPPPELVAKLGQQQQQYGAASGQQQQQQPVVLQELPRNWLKCQDAQGIYYFNQVTQQSSDTPPPDLLATLGQQQQQQVAAMPAQPQQQQEPQILQELPGNWLKCKDAQGIYYFNRVTQQSSDQLPPELAMMAMGGAAAPAPAPAAAPNPGSTGLKVLRQLPGNWLECQDAEGIFYFNEATKQSTVQPPAEFAPPGPVPSVSQGYSAFQMPPAPYTQGYQYPDAQPISSKAQQQMYNQPAGITAMQQQAMQAQKQAQKQAQMLAQAQAQAQAAKSQPQNAPRQKWTLGDWAVYEDQQGEFYVNVSTGQQFDKPPQALLQTYQAALASGQLR